jgi:hypothetical protein
MPQLQLWHVLGSGQPAFAFVALHGLVCMANAFSMSRGLREVCIVAQEGVVSLLMLCGSGDSIAHGFKWCAFSRLPGNW